MQKLEFYIVDVFAERKYAGNQLAVFRNSGDLNPDEMQKIARETNFSETTFITSDEMHDGGFDVRIFTPEAEIPFASPNDCCRGQARAGHDDRRIRRPGNRRSRRDARCSRQRDGQIT